MKHANPKIEVQFLNFGVGPDFLFKSILAHNNVALCDQSLTVHTVHQLLFYNKQQKLQGCVISKS